MISGTSLYTVPDVPSLGVEHFKTGFASCRLDLVEGGICKTGNR